MFETDALAALEKVLGQYIVDVITKRRTRQTKAEIIESVKIELSRVANIDMTVEQLTIAARELDNIVRDDSFLRWQHGILAVGSSHREIRKKLQDDVEAVEVQFHENIARRRRKLTQWCALEQEQLSQPDTLHEETDEVRLIEVDADDSDGNTDASQRLTSWQEKLMNLQSEIRRERRQAKDK